MDLGLAGKRALLTGATRGIGRSIAEVLAAEGCAVALCARTAADVEATVAGLRDVGATVYGSALDVHDLDQLREWVTEAAGQLGGVDIVVSNVSAQSFDWRRSVEIDLLSCVTLVDAARYHLSRSEAGAIVAIASQAGLLAVPSYKPYAAVKAALINYMGSLSRELAPSGVRVNTVSPGEVFVEGGFWDRIRDEDPNLYARVLEKNIMGRLATPEEVARAAVFLASPAASFISGANLLVDGASREFVQY
jgi:3-oxoacyl-[acyl-carrier protein] reductase